MKKNNLLIIAMLTAGLVGTAMAQDKSGYWVDANGNFVRSGSGACMRSNAWTPALALKECEVVAVAASPAAAAAKAATAANSQAQADTTVAAESPFAFGAFTLQAAAVSELDAVVAKIKGSKVKKVTVTGHTDRLGSVAVNKALAKKRAAAVKNYLVSKGIAKGLIQSVGVGSTQPKTAANACTGSTATPELIACLAADRRVEIQVTYR